MEAITLTNVFFALVGLFIYVGLRFQSDFKNYNKSKKKKGTKGLFKFWWQENQIQVYISLGMIFVLLYFAPTLIENGMGCHVHADSHLYEVYSIVIGYATYSIWFQFINNAKKMFQK